MEQEKNISPTKRRQILVQLFYRYLLMNQSAGAIKQDLLDEVQGQFDEIIIQNVEEITDHLSELIQKIKPLLVKEWKWERIPALIQAILVVGTWEITMTTTPKAVTINELTQFAKKLGLDQDYKFINAILDKLDKM